MISRYSRPRLREIWDDSCKFSIWLEIETLAQDPVPVHVRARGRWTFSGMKEHGRELERQLAALHQHSPERIAWDLSGIGELDDAGAAWLVRALRGAKHVEVSAGQRELGGFLGPSEARVHAEVDRHVGELQPELACLILPVGGDVDGHGRIAVDAAFDVQLRVCVPRENDEHAQADRLSSSRSAEISS